MFLLSARGVKFRKGDKKANLLRLLAQHLFQDLEPQDIEDIVSRNALRCGKTEDDRLAELLHSSKDLSIAVDALAELDHETAQAFPEMTRARKIMRARPKSAPTKKTKIASSSSSSSAAPEPSGSEAEAAVVVREPSSSTNSDGRSDVTVLSFKDVDSPTVVVPPPLPAPGDEMAPPSPPTTGGGVCVCVLYVKCVVCGWVVAQLLLVIFRF